MSSRPPGNVSLADTLAADFSSEPRPPQGSRRDGGFADGPEVRVEEARASGESLTGAGPGGVSSLDLAKTAVAPPWVPDEAPASSVAPTWRFPSQTDEMAMSVADPLIGMVIAERYRIVEGLGRGGMGIVYKVEHTRIGKLLAMKLLTGELTRNPDVVRRFKQEALTASRLSSPNTVQVFDFGVADGLTYLVMELVSGDDLGRVLRTEGPMDFTRLGKIMIQVCSSLAEAHQQGIVHRDVKPENIMIVRAQGGTDISKVLDFGLAKLRESSELNAVTLQGTILGTPYFMAPEQVRAESVDQRADIYALGAVMYRALTGHYVFNGATPMAVFVKHLSEPPIPPSERAPERGIPPSVSRLVMRALAKDPGARFQRAEDLQEALVDEVRALGTSSVEALLDSGQVRRLAGGEARAESAVGAVGAAEIATRDEVEAYERKLRRMRTTALGSVAAVALLAGLGAARLYAFASTTAFTGAEAEPNDAPSEAGALLLGRSISGLIGQRPDATHGDRDFYAITVTAPESTSAVASPAGNAAGDASAYVRLSLSALPNIPLCAFVYRAGQQGALGQYCVGRAGRDLVIPALRLEPGPYLVGVLQDLNPYGGPAPFLHENVSDRYSLLIEPTEPAPGMEIEPNDQVASANPLEPGDAVSGVLAWSQDADVFCVPPGSPGAIRWTVRDGTRDAGVVLEATPMRGPVEIAPVRIHSGAMFSRAPTASDALDPWESPEMPEDGSPRCLRVRLANDTWNSERGSLVPYGSSQAYAIEVRNGP